MIIHLELFGCRHTSVTILRAHKDVLTQYHGKEMWVDEYKCYNYIACRKCGKVLDCTRETTRVYGTAKELL